MPERETPPPFADQVYAPPMEPEKRRLLEAKLPWLVIPSCLALAAISAVIALATSTAQYLNGFVVFLAVAAVSIVAAWNRERHHRDGLGRLRLTFVGLLSIPVASVVLVTVLSALVLSGIIEVS